MAKQFLAIFIVFAAFAAIAEAASSARTAAKSNINDNNDGIYRENGEIFNFSDMAGYLPDMRYQLYLRNAANFHELGDFNETSRQLKLVLKYHRYNALALKLLASVDMFSLDSREMKTLVYMRDHPALIPESFPGSSKDSDLSYVLFALYITNAAHHDYDRAFQMLVEANDVKRQYVTYDPSKTKSLVDRLKLVFKKNFLVRHEMFLDGFLTPEETSPIFIVGLPRSGSTLLETVLDTQPNVIGAGEGTAFAPLVARISSMFQQTDRIGYPEIAAHLAASDLSNFGNSYMKLQQNIIADLRSKVINDRKQVADQRLLPLKQQADDVDEDPFLTKDATNCMVVDKMLENFLHIGFIRISLPNAKIIHTRRHPMDLCFSNYETLFAQGSQHQSEFSSAGGYSYNLDELAEYYRVYDDLMKYWRRIVKTNYLEIKYEEFVSDFNSTAVKILDFVGLPWNDTILEFSKTKRAVTTASAATVRQPVFKSSVGKWQKYKTHLQPLYEKLAPLIKEYEDEIADAATASKLRKESDHDEL